MDKKIFVDAIENFNYDGKFNIDKIRIGTEYFFEKMNYFNENNYMFVCNNDVYNFYNLSQFSRISNMKTITKLIRYTCFKVNEIRMYISKDRDYILLIKKL